MPLDALSDEYRYKHGVNDHFSQAVYTGFGNFSAVDIPVIVKLLFVYLPLSGTPIAVVV